MTSPKSPETRAKAWKTRRAKYGEKGHDGAYQRPCPHCHDMRMAIASLCAEEILSEGQASKLTGLDRVELRKMMDDATMKEERPETVTVPRKLPNGPITLAAKDREVIIGQLEWSILLDQVMRMAVMLLDDAKTLASTAELDGYARGVADTRKIMGDERQELIKTLTTCVEELDYWYKSISAGRPSYVARCARAILAKFTAPADLAPP